MGIQAEKIPRKVHVNTASQEEKENFKKRQNRYLWISSSSSNSNSKKTELYHSILRRVILLL